MTRQILVHPTFDAIWPWAADAWCERWRGEATRYERLDFADQRPAGEVATADAETLVCLGVPLTPGCLERLPALRQVYVFAGDSALAEALAARGIRQIAQRSEGFWGQSVAECALALTLNGLRRIPQQYSAMIASHDTWAYQPPENRGVPGGRGQQYCDDPRFSSGTIAGKRVRIVGMGNIASRYADWCQHMGAEVAAWDPFAPEPAFHRSRTRRVEQLADLMGDAEIFAPMLPHTPKTRGIVTDAHLQALPTGCLVVLITRAQIVHMPTLRARVMADELALAADVFDIEPVPLDDPLLGRHNVVHTPHIAGRTQDANVAWVDALICQFT